MKKRVLLLITITLALLVAVQGFGQFGYGGWRRRMLRRTLSISGGFWAAMSTEVTKTDGSVVTTDYKQPDWLFSVGAKLWFYQSNFGVGVDGILLDMQEMEYDPYPGTDMYGNPITNPGGTATMTTWLVDLDVFYRLPISPTLLAVGGAGLSYNVFNAGGHPLYEDSSNSVGFNVKLGGELFIDREISVTGMFTWHTFKQGALINNVYNENLQVKMLSFGVMANIYL